MQLFGNSEQLLQMVKTTKFIVFSTPVGGLLYAQMRDLQSPFRFVSNRQMMILYDTNDMGCWNDWRECYLLQKCQKCL